jgi:hypothetical protein
LPESGVEKFFSYNGKVFLNKLLTSSKYGIPCDKLFYEYNSRKNNWEFHPDTQNFISNHTRFVYYFRNRYFIGDQSNGCQILISSDGGKTFAKTKINAPDSLVFYPLGMYELNGELYASILSKQSRVNIFRYQSGETDRFELVHKELLRTGPQLSLRNEVNFKNQLFSWHGSNVVKIKSIEPSITFEKMTLNIEPDSISGNCIVDFVKKNKVLYLMLSYMSRQNVNYIHVFQTTNGLKWDNLFHFIIVDKGIVTCFEKHRKTLYFGTNASNLQIGQTGKWVGGEILTIQF